MKKIFILLLCCLFLSGCVAKQSEPSLPPETETSTGIQSPISETTAPIETSQPPIPLNLYVPDENAISFETIPTVMDTLDENQIVQLLIEQGVLNADISLNSMEVIDNQLNLDFSQEFLGQLNTYGTAGERMMIGSVVNTFLDAYEVETVYITADGEIMESGHVIYDFPMGYFE